MAMPKIDVTALDRELKQGVIRPVYFLVGDEPYLAQGAVSAIKEAAGRDGQVLSISARDAKGEEIISALRNVPLMGGRPLVILRDGEALSRERKGGLAGTLESYLNAPVAEATLVVVAEKLDGRTRIAQLASKSGAMVECRRLYDDRLPSWIGMQVKRSGRQISMEAAKFLADMVGNDLGQLAGAIDRTILYIGDKRIIDLKDVEEAVADTHQRDIFDLTDAVGRKELSKALSYLHNLIQAGQPPPLILHMLARHFRILSKAKEIAGRTRSRKEIAGYAGVNPYYVQSYVDQSGNFSKSELRRSFATLHRCDRDVKRSRLPKERVLERAIVSLVEKKGAGR